MSYKADSSLFDKVTLPTAANGTTSRSFSVPRGARVLAIHCPDLTVDATLTVEGLDPLDSDQASETWRTVAVAVIAAGALGMCTLSGIPDNQTTVIPVADLGGGIFRFVASAGQTGAADALTIRLSWGF